MVDYSYGKFGYYQSYKMIARGGFADVYKAQIAFLDEEVHIVARMYCPNIVSVLNPENIYSSIPYIAMAYAPNGSFHKCYFYKVITSLLYMFMLYIRRIFDAFAYIYNKGFVHQDVKPANMFLGSHNGKVLHADFGIAMRILRSWIMGNRIAEIGASAYRQLNQGTDNRNSNFFTVKRAPPKRNKPLEAHVLFSSGRLVSACI